jgi:hypothetical protein
MAKEPNVTTTVAEPEVDLDNFDLDPESDKEVAELLKGTEEKPAPVVADKTDKADDAAAKGVKTALVQEREKRRGAQARWEQVNAEREKLQAQLNLRTRQGVSAPALDINFGLSADELKGITDAAEKAETFGQVAHIAVTGVAKTIGERAKKQIGDALGRISKETSDALFSMRMDSLERIARINHKGSYDKYVQESGIMAGLTIVPSTGKAQDEALARQVFGADDPAEELYQLAVGKLVAEGKLTGAAEPEVADTDPDVEEVRQPVKPVQPQEVVAAERAVIDRVVKNGQKPRGISDIPSAAPSKKGGITKGQIDKLSEDNPDAYRKLMASRPDIREWYLS